MVKKCIDCSFHKVIPDPDPTDWFCADDAAIVCLKEQQDIDLKSKWASDRQDRKVVSGSLRPYQVNKVSPPIWCPISKSVIREKVINQLLNGEKVK